MEKKVKFLLSVVNIEEAKVALKAKVDILDIKNPQEGSLGGHFPLQIKNIRKICPPKIEVSAAVGDVPNKAGMVSQAAWGLCWCGVDYIKIGLWGVRSVSKAIYLVQKVSETIHPYKKKKVKLVIAGYADAHLIKAVNPLKIPFIAKEAKADVVMIDTAIKGKGNLLTYLNMKDICHFIQEAKKYKLITALAGKLNKESILALKDTGVDIIGIRSLACIGDRVKGRISYEKICWIKELLS
jgi:hypothetical protein